MSALTNYDKFNGIGDEEAAADEAAANRRPVVTRLDAGQTINVGKDGWSVAPAAPKPKPAAPKPKPAKKGGIDYSKWDNFEDSESEGEPNRYFEDTVDAAREAEWKEEAEMSQAPYVPPPKSRPTAVDATANGGTGKQWDPSGYGSEGIYFAWSQTAEEVTMRFSVSPECKAKDVECALYFHPEARRCHAKVKAPGLMGGWPRAGLVDQALFQDVWCAGDDRPSFKVAACAEDAEAWAELDWELEDAPFPLRGKCVRLTARKRSFSNEVVIWWRKCFRDAPNEPCPPYDEEWVDTTELEARKKRGGGGGKGFQAAWDAAHAAFQQKVKERPQPKDVSMPELSATGPPPGDGPSVPAPPPEAMRGS